MYARLANLGLTQSRMGGLFQTRMAALPRMLSTADVPDKYRTETVALTLLGAGLGISAEIIAFPFAAVHPVHAFGLGATMALISILEHRQMSETEYESNIKRCRTQVMTFSMGMGIVASSATEVVYNNYPGLLPGSILLSGGLLAASIYAATRIRPETLARWDKPLNIAGKVLLGSIATQFAALIVLPSFDTFQMVHLNLNLLGLTAATMVGNTYDKTAMVDPCTHSMGSLFYLWCLILFATTGWIVNRDMIKAAWERKRKYLRKHGLA